MREQAVMIIPDVKSAVQTVQLPLKMSVDVRQAVTPPPHPSLPPSLSLWGRRRAPFVFWVYRSVHILSHCELNGFLFSQFYQQKTQRKINGPSELILQYYLFSFLQYLHNISIRKHKCSFFSFLSLIYSAKKSNMNFVESTDLYSVTCSS